MFSRPALNDSLCDIQERFRTDVLAI